MVLAMGKVLFAMSGARLLEKMHSHKLAASNTPAFGNTIRHSPLGWRITEVLAPKETP